MDNPIPQTDNLDAPFSQLFGSENGNVTPTTAPQADAIPQTPPVQPQGDPQVTPQPQQPQPQTAQQQMQQAFELRTKTGTVYKSVDDAVKGIEHKDSLISQLRQTVIEATGVDPLTGQPTDQQFQQPYGQPYGQPNMPQQMGNPEDSYLQNPQKYFQDLYAAYQTNDPNKYFAVQQRLIEEKTMAQFAPVVPVIQRFALQGSVDQVASTLPEFKGFYGSQGYKETLQQFPALAQAIQVSEQNLNFSHQLPDLYKMVYSLHQANRLPELIRQQQQSAPTTPQVPPARPTASPSALTPPQPVQINRNTNLASDSNARKSIIEQFENAGKADLPWR